MSTHSPCVPSVFTPLTILCACEFASKHLRDQTSILQRNRGHVRGATWAQKASCSSALHVPGPLKCSCVDALGDRHVLYKDICKRMQSCMYGWIYVCMCACIIYACLHVSVCITTRHAMVHYAMFRFAMLGSVTSSCAVLCHLMLWCGMAGYGTVRYSTACLPAPHKQLRRSPSGACGQRFESCQHSSKARAGFGSSIRRIGSLSWLCPDCDACQRTPT